MKTIIAGILGIGILFSAVGIGGYFETHYTINGEITGIQGNQITITDIVGKSWSYTTDDIEEIEIGKSVEIKFFTNATADNRNDDEIITISGK